MTEKKTTTTPAPARKSMGPKRVGKKQRQMVSFELDGFEGEFTLPKLANLPLGVAAALTDGDLPKLLEFIGETASEENREAVGEIEGDEIEGFMAAWSVASGVEAGK